MFDVEFAGEGYLAFTGAFIFRVVHRIHHLHFSFREIGDDYFHRIDNAHHAVGALVQIFAHAKFQQRKVNHIVALRHAYLFGKQAYAFRRIAAAAQSANGGHARVVPAVHIIVFHQFQ